MGSHLIRNRHLTDKPVKSPVGDRRFRSAINFWKFSPILLRLRLLPGWVYVSLLANAALLTALLTLLFHYSSPRVVSSAALAGTATTGTSDTHGSTAAHQRATNAQANLTTITASTTVGQRHQLNYEQWKEVLTQEADLAASKQPQRLSILAGDSISLWFPEAMLPLERTWLNQGISGETTSGLLKRLDIFDRTQPETIFVMIGINDLLRGTSDATLLDNQQQIIRQLKSVHPQAQIVVQSILPHGAEKATWEGRDRLLNLPNQHIAELNQQLESIAKAEAVYFLDLYSLFTDAQGNLSMAYSTDGLHLNDQGYQVWSIALQVYSHEVLEPDLVSN